MNNSWLPGPQNPALDDSELHLWLANLNGTQELLNFYKSLLNEEEYSRSQRFKFRRDQRRFIFGRGVLRELLGRYLQENPALIEFQYTSYGKPYIGDEILKFNLAHCQDWGLYGFCKGAEVGVDIECIRQVSDAEEIARRFFAPAEYEAYMAAAPEARGHFFFSFWTLKEAFIKAVGQGLSYPLDAFEVNFYDHRKPRLLVENRENFDWSLFSFQPEMDCITGVAVYGQKWKLSKFRYQI